MPLPKAVMLLIILALQRLAYTLARLLGESLYLIHKGVDILKLAVNRGKAYVGHNVNFLKARENKFADVLRGNLADDAVLKLGLDVESKLLGVYGALLTSALNTELKLVLIKELTPAVTLNNCNRNGVNDLIGGKALSALGALAAALDAGAVVDGTGVKHSGILTVTNRTLHIFSP